MESKWYASAEGEIIVIERTSAPAMVPAADEVPRRARIGDHAGNTPSYTLWWDNDSPNAVNHRQGWISPTF